jgi:hypothetical protein
MLTDWARLFFCKGLQDTRAMVGHGSAHPGHSTPHLGAGVLVLCLHLLLVVAWWTSRPDTRTLGKDVDATTAMVWLGGLVVPPIEAVKPKRSQTVPASGQSVRRNRDHPARDPVASIGAVVTESDAAPPTADVAPAPQHKQLGSALNLSLSPQALDLLAAPSLAGRTPFQGRLPATVERQIAAAAADTGPWTEERIDIDHIRLRRGNTCIVLTRPEIAKIDPFSESMRRMPWAAAVSSC